MSEPTKAVFLSYAREDTDAARRIADALRAFGVEVWFDQSELRGGDAWDQQIRRQIKDCALFLPIISQHTQARGEGYFRLEWKLAAERTHLMAEGMPFVLPLVVDDARENEALVPAEFMRVQWTRLPQGVPSSQFVEQVKRLLDAPRKAGANPPATVATPHSAPRKSGLLLAFVGAVAVAAIGAAIYFALKSPAPGAAIPLPTARVEVAAKSPITPAASGKSIAVLPFANMSEDKDSAFFADGMHEDILTNLAVIRELRVTSRTSVMEYRGTTKKIRQIGAELGVAYVLEGSVRRAGNKVRVTGQLINVATDEHVWAKSYDRDLTDIFAIQSELSRAIATALSAALSPQEKSLVESRPTNSLAAYDLYLKARAWDEGSELDSNRAQAEAWLGEALELDPTFAQGWALLGVVHTSAYSGNEDRTPERLAQAKAAIDTAVRLAPGDPMVIESQGNFFYRAFKDYAQAAVHYRRLLALNPNSAIAYLHLGFLERRQNRWLEGLAYLEKSAQLDPRKASIAWEVGDTLQDLRRYDEAVVAFARAAELAPDNLGFSFEVPSVAFFARGSTRELEAWLASPKPAKTKPNLLLYGRRYFLRVSGDWDRLAEFDREHPYLEAVDEPRWENDVDVVGDLINHNDLALARARAKQLIPELNALVEKQPTNAGLWRGLARLYSYTGDRDSALRCARRMRELLPESVDAKEGPSCSRAYAGVLAWTGDKEGAIAEVARLLRTPRGGNVYFFRVAADYLPLRGDPRFEALLADPKNNAPLF